MIYGPSWPSLLDVGQGSRLCASFTYPLKNEAHPGSGPGTMDMLLYLLIVPLSPTKAMRSMLVAPGVPSGMPAVMMTRWPGLAKPS